MDDILNTFEYDATGVSMDTKFDLLPLGDYELMIDTVKPSLSKSGHPMVSVKFKVVDDGQFAGRKVFHNVVFIPAKDENGEPRKGAGIALFFLKCIGEPHEPTKLKIDPYQWVGKSCKARIGTDIYEGKTRNKIKYFITDLPNLSDEKLPWE